jgi:hypothetical protein
VIEYQKRTSAVDWDDYVISITGVKVAVPEGKEEIGRVIEESTSLLYDMLPALGLITVLGSVLYRGTAKFPSLF